MKTHELKTWPLYYQDMVYGPKNFEVRRNDRDFQVGDLLVLREFDPTTMEYSGREATRRVTYVLDGGGEDAFGLAAGHVVMGIGPATVPYHCPYGHLECDDFPGCGAKAVE